MSDLLRGYVRNTEFGISWNFKIYKGFNLVSVSDLDGMFPLVFR